MKDSSQNSQTEIVALKCQSALNPIGVDTTTPKFSWLVKSRERGQKQTAYQILVSDNLEDLSRDNANLWDSGLISSPDKRRALRW